MDIVLGILITVGGLTGIGVLGVYALTLVDRAKSRHAGSDDLRQRLEALEQRLAENEDVGAQLAEMNEQLADLDGRLEFAERILQQVRERDRLSPGA